MSGGSEPKEINRGQTESRGVVLYVVEKPIDLAEVGKIW